MINAIFKNVNNLIFYTYLWVCFIFSLLIIYLLTYLHFLGALIRNEHHLRKSCKHIKLVVLVHICISWCKSSKVSRILFAANSSCRKRVCRRNPFPIFSISLLPSSHFERSFRRKQPASKSHALMGIAAWANILNSSSCQESSRKDVEKAFENEKWPARWMVGSQFPAPQDQSTFAWLHIRPI